MSIVNIIGGGISGLICAIELEKHGIAPIIIEKDSQLGGRLKTTKSDNCYFDHGFQVLLTAYPAAQKYLNFEKLKLQRFLPGAAIFKEEKIYEVGDPFRHMAFFRSTTAFPSANVKDSLLVLKLILKLKWKSVKKIFETHEITTEDYLISFGFSESIIRDFFKPFLGGIFLDSSLQTSSRMFEFVMKMFSRGSAAIPLKGIQEIPRQLQSKLQKSSILRNAEVLHLDESQITLASGKKLKTDYTIIATDPTKLLPNIQSKTIKWNKCLNLYFRVDRSLFQKPILGLIADTDSLINNFHFVTDLQPCDGTQLISATVLKYGTMTHQEIIRKVEDELSLICHGQQPQFVRLFEISEALPVLGSLKNKPGAEDIRISDRIFMTGDHLSNPSLNGAMESGKATADLLIETMKKM